MIDIIPSSFQFKPNSDVTDVQAMLIGRSPGHIEITASAQPSNIIEYVNRLKISISFKKLIIAVDVYSTSDVYIRIIVAYSAELISISSVIGWCYFVAWSISFYPQIYINFRRKSVVGLNFDYLSLNIVGFSMYTIFNVGLYAIPEIQVKFFVCSNSKYANFRGLFFLFFTYFCTLW